MKKNEKEILDRLIASRYNMRAGLRHERLAQNRKHGFNESEQAFRDAWNQFHDKDVNNIIGPARRPRIRITPRERVIVTTVIQWLGTNVGIGFLHVALGRCGYKLTPTDKHITARRDRTADIKQNPEIVAIVREASKGLVHHCRKCHRHLLSCKCDD